MEKIKVLILLMMTIHIVVSCNNRIEHDKKKQNENHTVVYRNDTIEKELPSIRQIGTQIWLDENLNVVNFRNGDRIFHAQSTQEWIKAGEDKMPAWCYYEPSDTNNGCKLYNWYAVNDARNLAPRGWRIPSKMDYEQLFRNSRKQEIKLLFFEERFVSGNTLHKSKCNGNRLNMGIFDNELITFWTSNSGLMMSEDSLLRGVCFIVNPELTMHTSFPANYGLPVRCIQNQ